MVEQRDILGNNNDSKSNKDHEDHVVTSAVKNPESTYALRKASLSSLPESDEDEDSDPKYSKQSSIDSSGEDTPDSSIQPYQATTESIHSGDPDEKTGFFAFCSRVNDKFASIKASAKSFTRRQRNTLIVLFLGTLTSSLSVCLFPPFFPRLAESKGESATMYGLVIGTNCLTAFLVTPVIGKNLEKLGVNFVFLCGLFISGACCSLSGFLEFFPPGARFFVISVLIRILHATANAGVITSSIAFMASEFPTNVAFLFSLTRSAMNFAQMFGPAVGGKLHSIGGFKMPFFVFGGLQILVSFGCIFFLPTFRGKPKSPEHAKSNKSAYSILKVPGIWVAFLTFVFSTMSNGFLSITLEPKILRDFHISDFYVGVMFGLKDGANCIASPIWGYFCDRMHRVKLLIVLGSILAASSFIFLGPFPGLPIEHTLWLTIITLFVNGFGIGGQQVSGVASAMRDAVDYGFPDEAETHAFIAGLWSSLSGGGRFISRAGSGILVDHIGFQYTAAIVTGLHLTVILVATLFMIFYESSPTSQLNKGRRYSHQVDTNSPSEPVCTKSVGVCVPVIREDLEGSFMIGSHVSRASNKGFRNNRFRKDSYQKKNRQEDV